MVVKPYGSHGALDNLQNVLEDAVLGVRSEGVHEAKLTGLVASFQELYAQHEHTVEQRVPLSEALLEDAGDHRRDLVADQHVLHVHKPLLVLLSQEAVDEKCHEEGLQLVREHC